MGAATVARLHDQPEFLADLEASKSELAAARAKSLPPQNDCKLEAEALARDAPAKPLVGGGLRLSLNFGFRPEGDLQDGSYERAVSARKASSAEGVGCGQQWVEAV